MNLDSTKFAIVLDGGLPGGVAANAAAVLSLSVGRAFPDIVGPAVTDGDGGAHPGITQLPIPVLRAAPEALPDLRRKAAERGLYCVGFTHTAAPRAATRPTPSAWPPPRKMTSTSWASPSWANAAPWMACAGRCPRCADHPLPPQRHPDAARRSQTRPDRPNAT